MCFQLIKRVSVGEDRRGGRGVNRDGRARISSEGLGRPASSVFAHLGRRTETDQGGERKTICPLSDF